MGYYDIPENPEYNEKIRRFETTDPVHADLFNAVVQALISNDAFLKKLVQQAISCISGTYQQATGYTDEKIAALINGAPSTLDTLGEIAQAMQDNGDVVDALNEAIGKKTNEAEFDSYKNTVDGLLGNTDISGIGDGTLTGAISELNTGMTFVVNPMLENITITRQHCIKTGNIVIGSIEFNSSKEIPGIIPIISDLPSPAIAYTGIVQFVSLGTAISYLGYTANHRIYASTNMPSGIYTVSFIYNC